MRKLAAVLLPLAIACLFISLEVILARDVGPQEALDTLREVAKKAIDLNVDLAKFFIGLATATIGGIAYYLKSANDYPLQTRFSIFLIVGTVSLAVLSILFGHIWIALIRNQLASDYLHLNAPGIVWSERLQYACFLVSLTWFALLVWNREMSRMLLR